MPQPIERDSVVLSYDEAAKLIAALTVIRDVAKFALADLRSGRTNLAAARLETLLALNLTGGIQDVAQNTVDQGPQVVSLTEARIKALGKAVEAGEGG